MRGVHLKSFILYKIYYDFGVAYLGRTKQNLQSRLRGHFFSKPMHRTIAINLVTKIEYATFPTEADMFLYEIYYINKYKPPLNVDDKAHDDLTINLPPVEFAEFDCKLLKKWAEKLDEMEKAERSKQERLNEKREAGSGKRNA